MPIRITTIGRQRTVAGLAKALFDTEGSPEKQERAEAALLRANPQLMESGMKAGLAVLVPPVPGVNARADAPAEPAAAPADSGGEASTEPAIALARSRAQALAEHGKRSLDVALRNAKQMTRELKSLKPDQSTGALRVEAAERLESARAAADREVKRVTDAGKQLSKVTALALKDLAALGDAVKLNG